MAVNPIWFHYFSFSQTYRAAQGKVTHTHTTTRSDLEGPATQLNPALIQKSIPCVPRALLCCLHVRQHKANPGFSSSGNEIRYNGPNVFRLCSTSSELYRLPPEQTGRAGLPKKLSRLELLLQRIIYFSVFYNIFRVS